MWTWLFSSPKWETYLSRTVPATATATSSTASRSATKRKTDVGQNAETVTFRWVSHSVLQLYCALQFFNNFNQLPHIYFSVQQSKSVRLAVIYAAGRWLAVNEKRKWLCFGNLSQRNTGKIAWGDDHSSAVNIGRENVRNVNSWW